jgi:predicted methyltransferase
VFGIAIGGPENELHYWTGDPEIWNADAEVAARFYSDDYARAAVGILKRALPDIHRIIPDYSTVFPQYLPGCFTALSTPSGSFGGTISSVSCREQSMKHFSLYQSVAVAFAIVAAAATGLFLQSARAQTTPDYAALMAAPDRSDADRQADKRRDPLPFLAFAGARPGMKVIDMAAGGGYSTELMARSVAPSGTVYAQNPPDLGDKPKATFEARQKTPAFKDVVADIRPFDDPIPPDVHDLDLITFLFYYHDTSYMNVDRAAMDRKMFAALKPGGFLVIADHSALPGQGISVNKTLHRIEEATLQKEIEAAGFKQVAEGNFWRNPADTHDFPSYKPNMPVDNFVLKFQKPK